MTRVLKPCIVVGCHELTVRTRCSGHERAYQARRNRDPKRAGYAKPEYRAQPKTGICWICRKPGADTRDHIVPLAVDPGSIRTRPAHRSCNSSRGAKKA